MEETLLPMLEWIAGQMRLGSLPVDLAPWKAGSVAVGGGPDRMVLSGGLPWLGSSALQGQCRTDAASEIDQLWADAGHVRSARVGHDGDAVADRR
ncbi:hypothetical protein ACLOJK_025477 [Asimina triloba]